MASMMDTTLITFLLTTAVVPGAPATQRYRR